MGLSVFATLLTNYSVQAQVSIAAHLNQGNPLLTERLSMVQAALVGRGLDAPSAREGAFAAVYGASARQALVIAFERVLLLSGLIFALALPLLAFLKAKHPSRALPSSTPAPLEPPEVPAIE